MAGEAVWQTAEFVVIVAGAYAWKRRHVIAEKLRKPIPQTLHVYGIPSQETVGEPTLTVGSEITTSWDVLASVGSERTALWNVEAPTPSLARRLEELAAWYLHVS